MAFVLCTTHGGQVAPFLCEHLRDAMRKRLPLLKVYFVQAWYLGVPAWSHHLCQTCANEIGAVENPTNWKDDGSLDRLMDNDQDVAPVCPLCFEAAKVVG